MKKYPVLLGLLLVGVLQFASVAHATTFTVNSTASGGIGPCDASGCTLREAIRAANSSNGDDIITFDDALFGRSTKIINLKSALPRLSTNIELRGPGAARLTVRRAASIATEFRILTVGNGSQTGPTESISGLTITNGSAHEGGGIKSEYGTVMVRDCTVSGNSAVGVGGIYNYGGTMTVQNCTISGNSAGVGAGGMATYSASVNGTLTVQNCTISGNSATDGAGLWNADTLTVQNCTISGNSAKSGSGGIYHLGDTLRVQNSIVAGNTAPSQPNINGAFTGSHNITSGTAKTAGLEVNSTGQPMLRYNGGPTKTIALVPGSVASDAGDDVTAPATDQRGYERNGKSDIGAFEFNGVPPVSSRVDALIKQDGEPRSAFALNNVYQFTPKGKQVEEQSVSAGRSPGSTAIYQVRVQNDTNSTRTFCVRAKESAGDHWAVIYKRDTTNISLVIRSEAGYTTALLAPGESEVITIRMTPAAESSASKSTTLRVFLNSADRVTRDAVQAITTVAASSTSS